MWNSIKTRSLVAAVLISATIQGSLLWGMNSIAVTAAPVPAEIHYVTLPPVVVVGQHAAAATQEKPDRAEMAQATQLPTLSR